MIAFFEVRIQTDFHVDTKYALRIYQFIRINWLERTLLDLHDRLVYHM